MQKKIPLFILILTMCLLPSTAKKQQPLIQYDEFNEVLQLFKFFYDINDGYFVDIGAYDPMTFSNTLYFYSKGWTGINVEPSPFRWNNLQTLRTLDVNLNLGIGDKMGYTTLYDVVGAEPMSTINPAVKTDYDKYKYNLTKIDIPTTTMKQLCERYYKKKPDYLNLDVQGFSSQALLSNDWNNSKCRPNIITSEINHQFDDRQIGSPRQILESHGYKYHSIQLYSEVYVEGTVYDNFIAKYEKGKQILNKTKVIKKDEIIQPLSGYFRSKGYHLEKYEQTYYYFIKQNTKVFLQDVNAVSNINSPKKNRPILILSYNPENTVLVVRRNSVLSYRKIQVENITAVSLEIRKKGNEKFEVVVFSDHVKLNYVDGGVEEGEDGRDVSLVRVQRKIDMLCGFVLVCIVVWMTLVVCQRVRRSRNEEGEYDSRRPKSSEMSQI